MLVFLWILILGYFRRTNTGYVEVVEQTGCQTCRLMLTCRSLNSIIAILEVNFIGDAVDENLAGILAGNSSVATLPFAPAHPRDVLNQRCSGLNLCSFILSEDCPGSEVFGSGNITIKYACVTEDRIRKYCNSDIVLPREYTKDVSEGFIHNPGYPRFYSGRKECRWRITGRADQRIRVTILDISLIGTTLQELSETDSRTPPDPNKEPTADWFRDEVPHQCSPGYHGCIHAGARCPSSFAGMNTAIAYRIHHGNRLESAPEGHFGCEMVYADYLFQGAINVPVTVKQSKTMTGTGPPRVYNRDNLDCTDEGLHPETGLQLVPCLDQAVSCCLSLRALAKLFLQIDNVESSSDCKDVLEIRDTGQVIHSACRQQHPPVEVFSGSESIEVVLRSRQELNPRRGFLVHYSVVGCAELPVPHGAYLVHRTPFLAEFSCCHGYNFPDTGSRIKSIGCLGAFWNTSLPLLDCQKSSSPPHWNLTRSRIRIKPENSQNMASELIAPALLILGLFVLNAAVVFFIYKAKKKQESQISITDEELSTFTPSPVET